MLISEIDHRRPNFRLEIKVRFRKGENGLSGNELCQIIEEVTGKDNFQKVLFQANQEKKYYLVGGGGNPEEYFAIYAGRSFKKWGIKERGILYTTFEIRHYRWVDYVCCDNEKAWDNLRMLKNKITKAIYEHLKKKRGEKK